MDSKKLKIKYMISLIILTLITAGVGSWMLNSFFPDHYFSWYPVIPVYFFLFSVLILILYTIFRKYEEKVVALYIGTRMMKLFISIILLILYAVLVKLQIKDVLIVFSINYIIYMLFESYFFFFLERSMVAKNKNRQ